MKRPAIKEAKVKEYVDELEAKLEKYSSTTTKIKTYVALKNFIDVNSDALSKVAIDVAKISDKEDKLVERAMKFFKESGDYIKNLEALAEMIDPKELTGDQEKFINDSGLSMEEFLAKNNE